MENCPNSSSIKSRFTRRFLKALIKINRLRKSSTCGRSPREVFLRYRSIKVAADKSMASAARGNSKRAWSRAVLLRFKNQNKGNKVTVLKGGGGEGRSFWQESELRKLVPGVEAMDLCSMLDETAHYVKCLATQVQVMKKILDFYSAAA